MLTFTARRQQEIVRCGCTTAITGIKPNKRKRKVIGSKILHERRIVIPGAVQKSTDESLRSSGKNQTHPRSYRRRADAG